MRSLLLVYAMRKIWNVSTTASFERGEGSRISLQDTVATSFHPGSHTVYWSFELDSDVFNETRGRHHRDFPECLSRLETFHSSFGASEEDRSFKARWKASTIYYIYSRYTYITRCTRVLEDWWGMVDSEQDVNRIIVRRTREKKMYTDIKSVLSSCSYLTEIGIPFFRYRSMILLIAFQSFQIFKRVLEKCLPLIPRYWEAVNISRILSLCRRR